MAKGFDVLNVKSAVKARSQMDLSRTHLTTAQFGEIIPVFHEETIPGDEIKVDGNYFSRMAPLPVPTYGKFSFRTIAGFVPYHQIADDADAFMAGKYIWEGESVKHRYFTEYDLASFLKDYCATSTTIAGSAVTSANTEWTYENSTGSVVYNIWTKTGRYFVKVLNALGYAVPQGVQFGTSSDWAKGPGATKLSAYPLLALGKLYNDWMSQSTKYNTSTLSTCLKDIKHKALGHSYVNANGLVSNVGIYTILQSIVLNYENDYFTSAWRYPDRPYEGMANDEAVQNIQVPGLNSYDEVYVRRGNFGNMVDSNAVFGQTDSGEIENGSFSVTQRALDWLKRFDDWVRRNNYSGSRAVQQVYSRFGIKTDDYRSNYAHIISTDIVPVNVGDVTSTAPATVSGENVPLGDYAGKGIVSGDKAVSIKADDYGMFLILGYFTVQPMMAYGFDKCVLRSTPLDYYNPEFDGLGAEAISLAEVYEDPTVSTDDDSSLGNEVFGFTERYNSYRYGRDQITGDFRAFKNNPMNSWHTGRLLTDVRAAGNLVAQTDAVNTLGQGNTEYARIFNNTDGSADYFYLTCQFKVDAIRPMLNLNQVADLGEGNTAVPRNGNVVS